MCQDASLDVYTLHSAWPCPYSCLSWPPARLLMALLHIELGQLAAVLAASFKLPCAQPACCVYAEFTASNPIAIQYLSVISQHHLLAAPDLPSFRNATILEGIDRTSKRHVMIKAYAKSGMSVVKREKVSRAVTALDAVVL